MIMKGWIVGESMVLRACSLPQRAGSFTLDCEASFVYARIARSSMCENGLDCRKGNGRICKLKMPTCANGSYVEIKRQVSPNIQVDCTRADSTL